MVKEIKLVNLDPNSAHLLLAAVLLAVVFLPVVFLAAVFLAVVFLAAALFDIVWAAVFLTTFLAVVFVTFVLVAVFLAITLCFTPAMVLLFLSYFGFSGPPSWLTTSSETYSLLNFLWLRLMISVRSSRVRLCFLANSSRVLLKLLKYWSYSFLIFYCSSFTNWLKVGSFLYLRVWLMKALWVLN